MLENLKHGAFCILFGFLVMCGMRLAEHTIHKPEAKLLICIAESEAQASNCKPFDEFINQE